MNGRKNFRLGRNDFEELLELIKPYAAKRSKRARQDVITINKRIAMTLYYLKDQGHFGMTANLFGCSIASVSKAVKEVCRILSTHIGASLVKFSFRKK